MAKALDLDQVSLISDFLEKETRRAINEHTSRRDNPHEVEAGQLGLDNVDNTSDLDKPISKATQSALNDKTDVDVFNSHKNDSVKHISGQERNLWNTASSNADNACTQVSDINIKISAINTALSELGEQSQDFTGAVQRELSEHIKNTDNPHKVTANQIGLGNVNNTSDMNKPVSTAQQAALDKKANTTDLTAHTENTTSHITSNERTKWNNKQDKLTFDTTPKNNSSNPVTSGGLYTALSGKANASHGTHVSYSSTVPVMDGTASAGSSASVARSDHVHPTDTSRAAVSHTHTKSQITDFPSSMPASDVSAWAKADNKPSYSWDEITDKPTGFTATDHKHNVSDIVGTLPIDKGGTGNTAGLAASAAKLATARKIGGALFDGSSDVNPYEEYLNWGGADTAGGCGPLDMAINEEFSANRLAYMPPEDITVEYSTDGGSTWVDYGASNDSKTDLVTTSSCFTIGKKSSGKAAITDKLRITLKASYKKIYFSMKKVMIYLTTDGAWDTKVNIEYAKNGSDTTFIALKNNVPVSGWPGWNVININNAFGGRDTQTTLYRKLRFTFSIGRLNGGNYNSALSVLSIRAYGENCWNYQSSLANTGHLYTYDAAKNAAFPANVTADSFSGELNGNANSATKLATARSIRTNLGSASAVNFDGTADITPGITGILPITNGGTNAATAEESRNNLGAAAASDLAGHSNDTTKHITAAERTAWNGKANASHGTHVTFSSTAPKMDGTASVGSASTVAKSDHVHPIDTSRAAAKDLSSHTGDTTKHITATERKLWNDASNTANTAYEQSTSLSESVANIEVEIRNLSGQAGGAQGSANQVQGNLTDHINDKANPHQVSKTQIGLSNVDNTSDANKPVSTAQQAALDKKANTTDLTVHTENTTSHITSNERTKWNNKQEKLTFDTTPKSNSSNPVTSGGVYTALSGKANASHGTHVSYSSTVPVMNGTAKAGTAGTVARSDHVHPTDTTRAPASHAHSVSDITGILPVTNGGTGNTIGLAVSATKLGTARTIDGVKFNGTSDIIHYGVCSDTDGSVEHEVSIPNFTLVTGARIAVKFMNSNHYLGFKLNVNNTGAKPIVRYGDASKTCVWPAGSIIEFIYDGANWVIVNGGDVAYSAIKLETLHTIRTDLGSTSPASFDGTANITPGVTGILPIENGGTGATTAPVALANLGAFPSTGGTINGDVNITGALDVKNNAMHLGSGNYGAKLSFGDGDYVHFYENPDNTLEIKADNINFVVTGKVTQNGSDLGAGSVTSSDLALKANKANPVFTGNISLGRKSGTDVLVGSFAVGNNVEASGFYSHAEGGNTTASGICAHAEGFYTTASSDESHAEGSYTTASGASSHAEGSETTASGKESHAEGWLTTASGERSHAEGFYTTASNYASHTCGKWNKAMTDGGARNNTMGDAFVIGNGTDTNFDDAVLSNCFRVTYAGAVYGKSAFNSTGADYAEYFEWSDGNPDSEDRVGYFVTLEENKICVANPGDYILGIVSGQPCIIGNADEDWLGRWEHDNFGRFVLEYLEDERTEISFEGMSEDEINALRMEPDVREEDGKFYRITSKTVDHKTSSWRHKANPDYDASQPYIERKDRKEWDAVGMVGVLSVRDDGTCQVNGFCQVAENGVATAADKYIPGQTYRVIKRVADNVVKVVFR